MDDSFTRTELIRSGITIAGLGPHGERAASPTELELTDAEAEHARIAGFAVGVVLHTTEIDWSRQQIDGITATLADYGAQVTAICDCGFDPQAQNAQLRQLTEAHPDAIISIPVDDTATAEAHRDIRRAGIALVLMDNVPRGLEPHRDYASVISSDNRGNGLIAAESLSNYIPASGSVGLIGFAADFFATEQRETAFRDWYRKHRPDVNLHRASFADPGDAERVAAELFERHPELDGLFVVWDGPALGAVRAARQLGRDLPITTVDLGVDAATELASDGLIKAIGAQQPYDQGVAEALAAINALLGKQPPPWVAVRALATTRENVAEIFERVWHVQPPDAIGNAGRITATSSGS